ncbi:MULTISPECIES: hypothetical protein [Mesorhizobium]|uniref:hypothetical protein n=1 Tax=Mesorhizobium sp. TaxID=1871066 RepID=UPI000A93F698|nr:MULTISPECIES: hypothetical protein [Mesorhizobium]
MREAVTSAALGPIPGVVIAVLVAALYACLLVIAFLALATMANSPLVTCTSRAATKAGRSANYICASTEIEPIGSFLLTRRAGRCERRLSKYRAPAAGKFA